MIKINETIFIFDNEIKFKAVKSSGPGGQHINKVSTGIILKYDISNIDYPKWFIANLKTNIISGCMIPKINTCLDPISNGVRGVVVVDWRKPLSILFELFSDKGAGTLIRK